MARRPQPPAIPTPEPRRPELNDGPLAGSVRAAIAAHPFDPSAVLALTYAQQIDQANHIPADLADAINTLHTLTQAAESPAASKALRKLVMRIAQVTVTGDLGPKLLAALDALTLTPKSVRIPAPTPSAGQTAKADTPADRLAQQRARRAGRGQAS